MKKPHTFQGPLFFINPPRKASSLLEVSKWLVTPIYPLYLKVDYNFIALLAIDPN